VGVPGIAGNDGALVAPGDPGAVEMGYERDRVGGAPGSLDIRWWLYLEVPGEKLRNQKARLGVMDNGFRFARGGRAATAEEAEMALAAAYVEAQREVEYWRGQPSHALGAGGELIPLGETIRPELP
jgi:hypothetical protein